MEPLEAELSRARGLAVADLVSIAVPTQYHYDTAMAALDADTNVLVEKPIVGDPERGQELIAHAEDRGLTLQVGHIERFNPVVTALQDLVADLDVHAIHSKRLGPPLDREIDDTAVMDLMIHDLDIVGSLVDEPVTDVGAAGTSGERYASANLQFESGIVSNLVASRVTQEKVRTLTISARECRVKADYIDQTIEIHRQSTPSFAGDDDPVHYRHEGYVEELTVERVEPLAAELRSVAEAARNDHKPEVTGRDGLRALKLAERIEDAAHA